MKNKNYLRNYFYCILVIVITILPAACNRDNEDTPSNQIITQEVTNVGSVMAFPKGTVISNDASPVTAKGTCWSIHQNPTLQDNKTIDGSGPGDFQSKLSGLIPGTVYYTRSYAIINGLEMYGNEVSFETENLVRDIDGNTYNTIIIGKQVWLAENLKTTHYNNGDPIATTTPANKSVMYEFNPKYQWAYDGNEALAATYGRLYSWYTIKDPRGICPEGWHIPSHAEWTELETYLIANGYNFDGTISKNKIGLSMVYTGDWGNCKDYGAVGNHDYMAYRNSSGFTALPGGYRDGEGQFTNLKYSGTWWSSTEHKPYNAYYRYLYSTREDLIGSSYLEFAGLSVRCIKDAERVGGQ